MPVQQNSDYSVMSMAEAASVINHFTPEMIDDVINKAIASTSITYSEGRPNIPQTIEMTYRGKAAELPEFAQDLNDQRTNLLVTIIDKLCNVFGLQFVSRDMEDPYTYSSTLYDFLVARFDKYLVEFLTEYIIREAQSLRDAITRSSTTVSPNKYANLVFSSKPELAAVYANLDWCLKNMLEFDISFNDIIQLSFGPSTVYSKLITDSVVDTGDFFKRVYVPFMMNNMAEVITNVKFSLQRAGSYKM